MPARKPVRCSPNDLHNWIGAGVWNLKLRRILEIYDEQLRAADKDDTSYSEFVTRLDDE